MSGKIIIAIVAPIVAILISVAAIIIGERKKIKRSFNNIKEKFYKIRDNQLKTKLDKIKKISKNNEEMVASYESLNERYVEFSTDKIVEIEADLEVIQKSIDSKNNKVTKELIKISTKSIEELYSNFVILEKDIDSITEKEKSLRELMVPIKEEFRSVRVNLVNKKEEYNDFYEGYEKHLNDLEAKMVEFDEFLAVGNYLQAEELITKIKEKTQDYKNHFEKLPELISFSLQVLPRRFEEALKNYETKKAEGFPLYNIKMNLIEEKIKETTAKLKKAFVSLDYEELEPAIKEVAIAINYANEAIAKEINAREKFDENIDAVYRKVSLVAKRFLKAKRDTQSIHGVFEIDEIRIEELLVLEKKIHTLDRIKGDLDSYIHAISKQPFSLLESKMNELNDFASETENQINNYINYIQSLGEDSQKAYEDINEYSIALNTNMNKVIYINHDVLVAKYALEVEETFELIDEIKRILKTKPINVRVLNEKTKTMTYKAGQLVNKIKESIALFDLAQAIIVFTNKYRSSFSDVNTVLESAQVHFENGEFEFAIDRVSQVLQEVHPQAYEQMLKRKGKIDE